MKKSGLLSGGLKTIFVGSTRSFVVLLFIGMSFIVLFAIDRESPPTTILRFHGSDTIGANLLPALAEAFLIQQGYASMRKVYSIEGYESFIVGEHDGHSEQIAIQAQGSSTAFQALENNQCDIVMSSFPINRAEAKRLLPKLGDLTSNASEHVIALDGIAVIVHPSNPISVLSTAQVADIFSGTVTNWSQLPGGRAEAITLYAPNDKSATYDLIKITILNLKSLDTKTRQFESSAALSKSLSNDPAGIGFIGFSFVGFNKVIALSNGIDAHKPSPFTIKTEGYPLSRPLYLYNAENPSNPNIYKFLEFALGSNGQRVVAETGFVNLDPTPLQLAYDEASDPRNQSARYKELTKGAIETAVRLRFRPGSDELDSRANRDIVRIVNMLSQPQYQSKKIMILGFTDGIGTHQQNCALSLEMAKIVKQALAQEGLASAQAVGLCDEARIAPSDTPESQEKNRRVEIWLK